VVITPYKLGLSFNVNATVIDEAHNLIDIQSIPLVKLKAALHELSMGDLIGHEFDPRRLYELAMPKLLDLLERGEKPLTATVLTKLARATLGWVEENEVYLLSFYRPRYKTLYISATLGPLAPLLHVPVVRVEGLKIPAVIATWVTTRFRDFDVAMAHRYNDIIFLMRKYFRRIVVFASSRVASLLTYDYAGEDLPSARDWEGVLLLYSRGKRGEGVDIEADAVLIAGASYLPPVVKLSRLGISHDDLTAIVTMQNVGRTIRSPSSRPFVVLGDERFSERLRRHIEQYFQLQEANDIQELDKALKQWHQQNSQQQTNQK
jgi:DNA excision repair protein ERCC-2